MLKFPLPPLILSPAFSWMCSCGIFDRAMGRYFETVQGSAKLHKRMADTWRQPDEKYLEYLAELPELKPWQVGFVGI